jgi:CheY-like chemotaxis protein
MTANVQKILLVEDSEHDVELTISALDGYKLANKVDVARDGAEALDYLYRRGSFADRPAGFPIVVLLDLKMPRVDGLEVLRQMKSDPELKSIPVVMLTSSREEQDLIRSYELGVNAYVVKPVNFQQFLESVKQLGCFWALINEPPPFHSPQA